MSAYRFTALRPPSSHIPLDTAEWILTGIPDPSCPPHGVASPIMGTWSEREQSVRQRRWRQCCGGRGVERGGGSFVRHSSKRWPSYLSTGALCNGILHCHFAPFIFRQGYYCTHAPKALCARTGSGFNFFFFHPVQNPFFSFPPSSTCCALEIMDHTSNEHPANSRSHWKRRWKSGWCTARPVIGQKSSHVSLSAKRCEANQMIWSHSYLLMSICCRNSLIVTQSESRE